jgi:anti-sigma factor RsiW
MTVRPISEDDLQALVDERLDPGRRADVEAYLAGNPEARKRVERLRALGSDLRTAFALVTAEPVPAQLNLEHLVTARRRPRVAAWQATAAAALLAIGGLGGWGLRGTLSPLPTGVDALAQEASANFAVYATDRVRPVELAASHSEELAQWFSARLDRPVGVPDLSGSGYRLMGGRLVATTHGPAGLLMYDDGHGRRLIMRMRPMAEPGDAPMRELKAGTATGYAWAQNGLGYGLVGATDPSVLHPLCNKIRRELATNT